ncbi:MAG: DUF4249 domain-containing protein, partial [Bacteroidota bacterium]
MSLDFRISSHRHWGKLVPAILLLLVSCVEEMELPEGFYQERMVVNAVLDPDSLVRVNVARSMPPNGKVEFEFINDADIRTGLNGTEGISGFTYTKLGWYENSAFDVDSESSYFLEVNSPDLTGITSSVKVPEKPLITDVRVHGDSISFRIGDNPDESNYYFVRTYAWQEIHISYEKDDGTWDGYEDTVHQQVETQSDLEYIEAWYSRRYGWINSLTGFTFDDEFWSMDPRYQADSYLFSDIRFNGQSTEFHMDISDGLSVVVGNPPKIDLFVHSLDENYYRYLLTLAQYLTTDETPFTDRARVHNNIQGGYG